MGHLEPRRWRVLRKCTCKAGAWPGRPSTGPGCPWPQVPVSTRLPSVWSTWGLGSQACFPGLPGGGRLSPRPGVRTSLCPRPSNWGTFCKEPLCLGQRCFLGGACTPRDEPQFPWGLVLGDQGGLWCPRPLQLGRFMWDPTGDSLRPAHPDEPTCPVCLDAGHPATPVSSLPGPGHLRPAVPEAGRSEAGGVHAVRPPTLGRGSRMRPMMWGGSLTCDCGSCVGRSGGPSSCPAGCPDHPRAGEMHPAGGEGSLEAVAGGVVVGRVTAQCVWWSSVPPSPSCIVPAELALR